MPSRILEMIKAKVSQLPKEVPKPQKPIKEPKIKNKKKKQILNYNFSQLNYIIVVEYILDRLLRYGHVFCNIE